MAKMRFATNVFMIGLFFILLRFSNAKPTRNSKIRYNHHEEELILSELESQGRIHRNAWRAIAEEFAKRREAKALGFSAVRSAAAIKQHFNNVLIKNKGIKVPNTVKRMYQTHCCDNVAKHYSSAEQEFINAQLRSCKRGLLSDVTWSDIKKKHDEMRESGCPGFSKKRSVFSLRIHFIRVMTPHGLVDEDIKSKFYDYFKTLEGNSSIEGANHSDRGIGGGAHRRYTPEEVQFIIKEVESHVSTYDPRTTWNLIAKEHEKRRKAKVRGFSNARTVHGIRQQFTGVIMRSNDIEVPGTVRQFYEEITPHFSCEEHDFINVELQTSPLGCRSTWKRMKKEHDKRRESGCAGFFTVRTAWGLHKHFRDVMLPRNLVDEAVKQKALDYYGNISPGCAIPEEDNNNDSIYMGCDSDGEDEVWDPIMKDLAQLQRSEVDNYGIDHSLFLDWMWAGADKTIFKPQSPYDVRTFEPTPP